MTSRESAGETPWARPEDSSTLLVQLLDALPTAIAFWGRDMHNVFANRAYIDWFGKTPDELRGLPARELLGPELFRLNRPYMERALAGERQVFERVLRTPSGDVRDAQIEYTPYRVRGEVIGMITIIVDVSERIRAERAARSAAEQVATLTERQRIEDRAHEGILQDLFAVQLRIERARLAVAGDSPAVDALDAALDRLEVAVADLRRVLTDESGSPRPGDGLPGTPVVFGRA